MTLVVWTEERIAELRRLVEARYSCSEIAAELGGITRNSVIGKMHRLGIRSSRPAHGGAAGMKVARVRKQKVSIFATRWGAYDKDTLPPEQIEIANVVAQPLHIPLARLNNITCRWPYGEHAPFSFCGCPTSKAPYCEAHTAQSIGKGTTSERLAAYAPKEAVAA